MAVTTETLLGSPVSAGLATGLIETICILYFEMPPMKGDVKIPYDILTYSKTTWNAAAFTISSFYHGQLI